jgi:hypothetical protein
MARRCVWSRNLAIRGGRSPRWAAVPEMIMIMMMMMIRIIIIIITLDMWQVDVELCTEQWQCFGLVSGRFLTTTPAAPTYSRFSSFFLIRWGQMSATDQAVTARFQILPILVRLPCGQLLLQPASDVNDRPLRAVNCRSMVLHCFLLRLFSLESELSKYTGNVTAVMLTLLQTVLADRHWPSVSQPGWHFSCEGMTQSDGPPE